MKKYLIVFCSLSILSCKKEKKEVEVKEEGYEVAGIVRNVPDSTMVVLSADNIDIDSAYVMAEKFQLSGRVEEPTNVYLVVKDSRDYNSFWLENNKMTFEAEAGKFGEAKITGSKTEEENDILWAQIDPLREEVESLMTKILNESMLLTERDSIRARITELREKETEIDRRFIREYPNSRVSTHILNIYKTTWGREVTSELFAGLSPEQKASEKGKNISKFIALNKNPDVGGNYVDLEQPNADGELVRLSDIKGKYTLIEFWASWCGPCRKTNPELVKNYERFKEQGFEIYAISLDQNKKAWLKAIEDDGLTWTNVSELKGGENEASYIYGINSIPDNFLIDENGTIIARDLRGETFTKKLEELFDKNKVTAN